MERSQGGDAHPVRPRSSDCASSLRTTRRRHFSSMDESRTRRLASAPTPTGVRADAALASVDGARRGRMPPDPDQKGRLRVLRRCRRMRHVGGRRIAPSRCPDHENGSRPSIRAAAFAWLHSTAGAGALSPSARFPGAFPGRRSRRRVLRSTSPETGSGCDRIASATARAQRIPLRRHGATSSRNGRVALRTAIRDRLSAPVALIPDARSLRRCAIFDRFSRRSEPLFRRLPMRPLVRSDPKGVAIRRDSVRGERFQNAPPAASMIGDLAMAWRAAASAATDRSSNAVSVGRAAAVRCVNRYPDSVAVRAHRRRLHAEARDRGDHQRPSRRRRARRRLARRRTPAPSTHAHSAHLRAARPSPGVDPAPAQARGDAGRLSSACHARSDDRAPRKRAAQAQRRRTPPPFLDRSGRHPARPARAGAPVRR